MEEVICRLCGISQNEEKVIILNDELKTLVEFYCHLTLQSDDRLTEQICFDCNSMILNFAKFAENVKEVQMKLLLEFSAVKVESQDFPTINEENTEFYIDETKVEPFTNTEEMDNGDASSNRFSSPEDSASDFEDSLASIKRKLIKKKSNGKRPGRPRKKNVQEDDFILQEISPTDRNRNGTIKKKALGKFEGKLWEDIKIDCAACNMNFIGPYQLLQHSTICNSQKYACSTCDNTIDSFSAFLNHSIEHQKSLNFCCVICSEMHWNIEALYQHYEVNHEKTERSSIFHCKKCGKYFEKLLDLTFHLSRFHNSHSKKGNTDMKNSFLCMESLFAEELKNDEFQPIGNTPLPDSDRNPDGTVTDEYRQLNSNRLWNNIMTYQCSNCSSSYESPYCLYKHYNEQHPNIKTNFTCKACPEHKTFLNLESFVNHAFTIHHEHLRHFCFICLNGFCDSKTLYQHYKVLHSEYKAFICLYCAKYHKSVYDLKQHLELHMSKLVKDPKVFNCTECSKSFQKQQQLQRHIDTHVRSDKKLWICELCGKSFNAKSTLINHKAVHQTERPFVCSICGEGFKNKYKLNYHKGIHTDEKNFSCEICGAKFRAKGNLKGHMVTHSGERPHACQFCEKRFSAKYDLIVHERLHTGEYTHECKICHEKYPSWSNFSKHMRGRHRIDPRSEKKKKYDALHKGLQDTKELSTETSSQYF